MTKPNDSQQPARTAAWSTDRPAGLPPTACGCGLALVVCLLSTTQVLAQVDQQRHYGLAGNDQLIWIMDRNAEPATGKQTLSLGVRTKEKDAFYTPVSLRGMVGKVRSATAVAMSLHVFFDGGTHRRYRFSTLRGEVRRVREHTEQPIPGSGVPVALAGCATTEALYVIIDRRTANEMLIEQNRLARDRAIRDAPAGGKADAEQEPEIEVVDVDAMLGVAEYFVGRYRLSQWEVVSPLPEWFDLWRQCHLAIDDTERVHVLFRAGQEGPNQHAWLDQGIWSKPFNIKEANGLHIIICEASKDGLFAAGFVEATGHTSLVALSFDGESWARHAPFELGTGSEQLIADGPAIAPFGDSIGLAALDEQQQLLFGLWPVHGGAAGEPFAAVRGLEPRPQSKLSWEAQSIAAFVVLGSLLMYVFLRRGQLITTPAELPPQFVVASYWRRLVAFALDLLPAALSTARFWAAPLSSWMEDYSETEPGGRPVLPLGDDLLQGWMIACAVYVLYCTICEASFASTPGKLTVRCQVVNETGQRCGFSQILVRNVLRFVELFPLFQLWPSFILMLFTRNRQRLGDLMARSLVVQRVPSSRSRTQSAAPTPPDEEAGTA